jgi:UDP-N-acetylmuramate-alanine ligase
LENEKQFFCSGQVNLTNGQVSLLKQNIDSFNECFEEADGVACDGIYNALQENNPRTNQKWTRCENVAKNWQPVEKCINYIDSEIACRATEEKQDCERDKDRLKAVLQEIIENITHEQVKEFYRACFVEMYPEEPIPTYLRSEKRPRL